MRYRPKRENYPIGIYGDIDYQERLERYCTYLENRNKALTEQCNIANVVGRSEQFYCWESGEAGVENPLCDKQCDHCSKLYPKQ